MKGNHPVNSEDKNDKPTPRGGRGKPDFIRASNLVNQSNEIESGDRPGETGSFEKKTYGPIDFVFVGIGLMIAISVGFWGASVESGLTNSLPMYPWVGGFAGGFVAACGGMLAAVFFLNIVSKFLFNHNAGRWQQRKEYPLTWHAALLLVFAIIEPASLIVVVTLGAIGGGVGYGATMNLAGPWQTCIFAGVIPVLTGIIALFLVYDFADGGTN